MSYWEPLNSLDGEIDEFATERASVEVSSQFTRVTTTVVLRGAGQEGRGEDVTYTPEDHEWFPRLEPPGKTTLGELSGLLAAPRVFEGDPAKAAAADHSR